MSLLLIFAPAALIGGIGEMIVTRITRPKSYRKRFYKVN